MKVIKQESHKDGVHELVIYTEGYPPWDRVENHEDLVAAYSLPNANIEVYNEGFTFVWIKRDKDCAPGGCGNTGSRTSGDALVNG
jgi:hypothetical protein